MGRGRTELRRSHPRTRRAELYRVTEAKKRIDCDGAGTDTAARRRHEVNFRRTRGEREVRRGWRAITLTWKGRISEETCWFVASRATMWNGRIPASTGVPAMTPVPGFSVSHEGEVWRRPLKGGSPGGEKLRLIREVRKCVGQTACGDEGAGRKWFLVAKHYRKKFRF